MTNAEKIQTMSIEELNRFIWWWKVDSISSFLAYGRTTNLLDARQQKKWLLEEEGITTPEETKMPGEEG